MRATLTALAVLLASPASAECWVRDHVAAFLKVEHGLALRSWGLSDGGDMMELFTNEAGHWAVVTTKPNQCASVSMPHKERGRLWMPPKPNKAIPNQLRMEDGDPT
jgi:hypothetical protein